MENSPEIKLGTYTDVALLTLQIALNAELTRRCAAQPITVFLNTEKHFGKNPNRAGGGWTKSVTALDKTKSDGYSIVGSFMSSNREDLYTVGKLYLDSENTGSYANPRRSRWYTLFTVQAEGEKVVVLAEAGEKEWVSVVWEAAEKFWAETTAAPTAPATASVEQPALA